MKTMYLGVHSSSKKLKIQLFKFVKTIKIMWIRWSQGLANIKII